MKQIFIGFFLSILSLCAFASSALPGGIKGKIIDAKTKEALEFVTIKITSKGSTSLIQGGVSDHSGQFSVGGVKAPGTYIADFSYEGYKNFSYEFQLKSSSQMLDLEDILLQNSEQMLSEVQVVGQQSQMRFEIDKKVFNVGQDLSSSGESASEVLANIPSVEVDNEGEVSLRGNSSVTIWINGKESGLTADNRAQILEQLPAETIDRIEVITNPSAKFSPEGTAGIINIILKENRKAGYFGSVQAGASTRGRANSGANINYSSTKLDANASIGYRHHSRTGGSISERTYDNNAYLNSRSESDGDGNHVFMRGGLTYHIDKKNDISANAFGMFGKGDNTTKINYDASNYMSQRVSDDENKMRGGNVILGYKYTLKQDHYIDFSTSYNAWGMDGSTAINQWYAQPTTRPSIYQSQDNNIRNRTWNFQLDYSNKINENTKIEAGYKGVLSHENSPIVTSSGTVREDAVADYSLYNRFIYDQDTHAMYATFSSKIGAFGYQLGMRGEYTKINTQSNKMEEGVELSGSPFTKDYFDLFPSAFLSYTLGGGNELQFNYSRRISRPWGGQLNSFQNITDSTNISSGNPKLMPEYANAYELNYIKTWVNHTLSVSTYYRTTEDVIQRVTYLGEKNVMYNTSVNVGNTQSAGLEFVAKDKIAKWLDLTSTLNFYYYKLDKFTYHDQDYAAQEQFSWNARMIANVLLPAKLSFQATGNYTARQAIAQGTRKANYSLDAGLKRNFFNKLIAVSVNARDILDSRSWKTTTNGDGFSQYMESWREGRTFGFTITYNFGNMKAKMNKNSKQSEPNSGYNDLNGGEE
ncbi:MAG: TonB-dependent receptor [Bacteroidaceae bacterium]|nr:TonB-dependent receptor [Bacteroidaceae bacterium]MBP9637416.1 TonB-dependent receptor [Bacteroidaceae bacterium]